MRKKKSLVNKEQIIGSALGLAVILGIVLALRFFAGSEGTWVCDNGKWVKEGSPSGPPPTTGCEPIRHEPDFIDPATLQTSDLPLDSARLRRDGPGMRPDTWYVHFDLPGGYTLFEVVFDDGAECLYDGQKADCSSLYPPSSAKTSFKGRRDGSDKFLVSELRIQPR